MKMFMRIAGSAAAILLLFSLLPTAVFAKSGDSVLRLGRDALGKMPNGAALQYVYDRLEDGCEDADGRIQLKHPRHHISWNELLDVYVAVRSDHPEYFWMDSSYTGDVQDNTVITVAPKYTVTGNALKAKKAAFNNAIKRFLNGLNGKSQYERSLLLHDRLVTAVDYVNSSNDQNAYGALVEGKAVCAGYARAYQLLMQRAGMPAWVVIGKSRNPTSDIYQGHEWNLVSIDNNWYYTDVSWDDQGEQIYHAFLNNTSAQIDEGHTPEWFVSVLPKATKTAANYFERSGQKYTSFDANKLASALKAGNNKASLFVDGDAEAFINNITPENQTALLRAMGAPEGSGCKLDFAVLEHEVQVSLSIIAPSSKPASNESSSAATASATTSATTSAAGSKPTTSATPSATGSKPTATTGTKPVASANSSAVSHNSRPADSRTDDNTVSDSREVTDGEENSVDSTVLEETTPESVPEETPHSESAATDAPKRSVPVWPIVGGVAVAGAGVTAGAVLLLHKKKP